MTHEGAVWHCRSTPREPHPPAPGGSTTSDGAGAAGIAVRLEGVEKRYGDVVAVAGVDLDVRDGEFFSMLGPSGSGKTTTLRMIAGFELPTAGRILLHGADVTDVPPFDRDVNTVFQDYALFPHMSVGDNVAYGLMVRKVPATERARRVADALRMVRLEGYDDAQAVAAVGRPAPARRARPGARQPPARAAPRRAARRARPEAPRGDADRAQGDPAAGRHHVHLRHARPGRGAHDERPAGGVQRRSDRAARDPGRGLRATRRHGSSPGSSGHPTCSAATSRGRSSGTPGRSRSGPRRSGSREPDAPVAEDETGGQRPHRERGLPGPRHPLHRRARRRGAARRHPAEPCDDLDRGARATGQGCPPGMEATARAPHRGWGGQSRGGGGRHDDIEAPGPWPRAATSRIAACSGAGGSPAPSAQAALGAGEGEVDLIIWAGYAERGATDPGLRLGHPVRDGDRLQGQRDRHDRLEQRRARSCSPATTTVGPSPAMRPSVSWPVASSRPSTRRSSPTTRTSSRGSRTRPTTRSTACRTASRTVAARTC